MLKHSVVLKFNNVEMLKTLLKMLKTNRSNPESNGKVRAALRWKLRRVARNGGHLMKNFCRRKVKWYVSPIDDSTKFHYTYNKKTK